MRCKLYIIIVFCCLIFLCSCSGKGAENETVPIETDDSAVTKPIRIGVSFDSFVIERWIIDRDVFVSTAEELGAEVNIQNANGDANEQISQLEYFIELEVDVIVVIAVDCEKTAGVVKKAKNAGIRVIAYDRLVQNADVDLYISFDSEEVGRLMARTLKEQVPEGGSIGLIFGSVNDTNVIHMEKGFFKEIEGMDYTIAFKSYAEGWLAEKGFEAVSGYLSDAAPLDGILCGNDDIAAQAIRALSERRLAGEICVVGQDAETGACQRIVEGTQAMTVYKPIKEQARKAAEYAVMLAQGKKIDTGVNFGDGKYYVPYEKLTPIAVTKENMDEVIIAGGFHGKNVVYMNMPK